MIQHIIEYIPSNAQKQIQLLLDQYQGKLKVSSPRKTKQGDFRVNCRTKECLITVNGNLNPYRFLITLIHELAHYFVWLEHNRDVKPHGIEWKTTFKRLAIPFLKNDVFPENIAHVFTNHLNSPTAASSSDLELVKVLNTFDLETGLDYISDVPPSTKFVFRNRGAFEVVEKVRTRVKCKHLASGKFYLFSPSARVKLMEEVKLLA